MEWANKNKFNSFNSYKGLTYYENYKKIASWLKGEGELPPPIECSLDPIMRCNQKCYYCNSQTYLSAIPTPMRLSYDEMYKLINHLAEWGVKGLCFGGGGEPTLNEDVTAMINLAHTKGLDVAVVTNGSQLSDKNLQNALLSCRWVGISIDSASREQYKTIRGADMFYDVIDSIRELVMLKQQNKAFTNLDIALKFLVLPENINSIYDACRLAKNLGVDDFHVRPVDLERKDFKVAQRLNLDMDSVRIQFERCHKEETDFFHVYTVVHKYDEAFHVKHDFKKCLAPPLCLQVCTDGNCYLCLDHRMEERFKLGSMNDLSWWGSDAHRDLILGIDPATECSRCTWCEYNRQLEEVVLRDGMCVNFP